MTKPPPIVFIARHGARLDAADKDWHLTSPTPYDPPLSYGGWLQSRSLGARIASLLGAREFTGEAARPSTTSGQSDLKTITASSVLCNRYKIIIHTSPYLRCLQTAIAVSAGINQQQSDTDTPESSSPTPTPPDSVTPSDPRCLLRVDAFLGEWLCPDYFDQITPPPSSDRMVASAKAELLRRGEVIMAPVDGSAKASTGHFPGGWGSQSHPNSPPGEGENQLLETRGASITSPPQGQRPRASTYDTLRSPIQSIRDKGKGVLESLHTNLAPIPDSGYVAPTPRYAISASDPIPGGYVAHARNTCTKIDYQWDSMRSPQMWGTGGEYGEEWSTMQERVHDGFEQMVQWYQTRRPSGMNRSNSHPVGASFQVEDDREAETVLIIITHGADCNSLISSLSGHSLLLDIKTASLTMAVRRDRVKDASIDEHQTRRSPDHARDDGLISREYVLKLVASDDHLRAGVNPSQLKSLSSPSSPPPPPPPPIPIYRNRLGPRPSLLQGHFTTGPMVSSANSSRVWTLASRPATVPAGVSGLWGSMTSPTAKIDEDGEDDFVPNFGDPRPMSRDSHRAPRSQQGWAQQLPQRTHSQRGLWGSAPALEARDSGMKRRWTMAEQKL